MTGLERIIRTIIHEVPTSSPYGSGTLVTVDVVTRLSKAPRTLTHLERYIGREGGRDRIPNAEQIIGRAQIGKRIK